MRMYDTKCLTYFIELINTNLFIFFLYIHITFYTLVRIFRIRIISTVHLYNEHYNE